MDPLLIDKIKEAVPNGSWLEILEEKQLYKIYEMLKKGKTNSEIIRTCQIIFSVKSKATVQELLPDLVKFRTVALDDKSLLKIEEAQKTKVAVEISNKLRNLSSKVDAMGRLNWLADQQTLRVIRLLEMEAKTLPMDTTTTNIDMLNKMLHNLQKAHQELKLDSATGQVTAEDQDKLKGLIDGFKDDGESMIQATHKLLELVEQRALILNIDEEGSYSVSSPKIEEDPEKVTA
jgi:ABC-type uncharacterized transport system ATPase subunit